jgi:hypothetical protein
VSAIEEDIRGKEERLELTAEEEEGRLEMVPFVSGLVDLFKSHKVGHMYRANIVSWFKKKGMSTESILFCLRKIEQTGVYLRPTRLPGKCLIYELRPYELSLVSSRLGFPHF